MEIRGRIEDARSAWERGLRGGLFVCSSAKGQREGLRSYSCKAAWFRLFVKIQMEGLDFSERWVDAN